MIRPVKGRAGLAAVVAGCVALLSVVVLTGAGNPTSGLKFTQSGHWIYNSSIGRVFHLDSATKAIDAQVPLSTGEEGAQAVQTDTDVYVLSKSRIDKFGKSDLTVAEPIEVPVNEQPVGVEAAGAVFAVYQQSGHVVRLGERRTTAFLGGALSDPVATSDGTLWVHRVGPGELCQLPPTADRMSCPASAPQGHKGGLVAIGDKAVFVDLTAQKVYDLSSGGLDDRSDLGELAVPDSALVAGNDVDGRIALVDRDKGQVHLVSLPERPGAKPAAPTTTKIPQGKYDRVASSGHGLALLNRQDSDLVTLDRDGKVHQQKIDNEHQTPGRRQEPRLIRGDDAQVYVESGKGDRVVVVDGQGRTEPVPVGGKTSDDPITPPKPKTTPSNTPRPPEHTPVPPPKTTPPETEKPEKKDPPETDRPSTPVKPGNDRPGNDKPERQDPPKSKPPVKPAVPKATVPGAPTGVTARAYPEGPLVKWSGAAPHGAPITGYQLLWTGGSRTVSASARSATVADLAGKSGYYVSVRAVNRIGYGPATRSNQVKGSYAAAESPREIVVSKDGTPGELTLAWDRPTMGDGTFLRYAVSLGSATAAPRVNVTGTEATIKGLTTGRTYTFYVRAITRAPDGQQLQGKYTSLSAAPVGAPERTKRVVASRGAGTSYENCEPPACAFIQVRIENLRPNTNYKIVPHVEGWEPFNEGATLRTSSEGHLLVDDRFPCSGVGRLVWATVTGPEGTYTSNKFTWKSG
ncbi:hypothetical protein GCM10009534_54150 [Kribbella sandramycini]